MKKILVAALAIGTLAMAGAAWAAETQVTVNAVVTGTCQFLTGGQIDFTLDPSSGGGGPAVDVAVDAVPQPTFWCTKNTTWTITDDNGDNASGTTHNMKHATAPDLIPYSFTYTATGDGEGRSSPIEMDIASTVLGVDYVDKAAGNYSDTVILTVNP